MNNSIIHSCRNEEDFLFLSHVLNAGKWLVRESQSQKGHLALTHKTSAHSIVSYRLGPIEQRTAHQINEWIKTYAEQKQLSLSHYLFPLISHHIYVLTFASSPVYDKFKGIWQTKMDPKHVWGSFDERGGLLPHRLACMNY